MSPMTCPSDPPKANANPTAQYMIAAIEKFVQIFATTVPAFLPREKPISRNMKPSCMKITSTAAITTHSVLMPTESGTPLACQRSAEAAAGANSEAIRPAPRTRTPKERLMNPPESRCGVAVCGPAALGSIGRVSKDPPERFAQPSGRSSERAKRACAMLDSGIRCPRRRAPSLRRSTGA